MTAEESVLVVGQNSDVADSRPFFHFHYPTEESAALSVQSDAIIG